jgi:hypothetical protein
MVNKDEDTPMNEISKGSTLKEIDSLMVIGSFLLIFGFAVLIAIFFTDTAQGKITNLICGGVLFLIGLGSVLISLRRGKKKGS